MEYRCFEQDDIAKDIMIADEEEDKTYALVAISKILFNMYYNKNE